MIHYRPNNGITLTACCLPIDRHGRTEDGTITGDVAQMTCPTCGDIARIETGAYKDKPPTVSFDVFASLYCYQQEQTKKGLRLILNQANRRYQPVGFMLLECVMMGSSRLSELVILPYGGKATRQTVPTTPVSPRGLASDMSVVKAILPAESLQ